MPIRLLALVLLLGAAAASAASLPKEPPVPPEDIDVDAMARAKDTPRPAEAAAAPASADGYEPGQVEPGVVPPVSETPPAPEDSDVDAPARTKDVTAPKAAEDAATSEGADRPEPGHAELDPVASAARDAPETVDATAMDAATVDGGHDEAPKDAHAEDAAETTDAEAASAPAEAEPTDETSPIGEEATAEHAASPEAGVTGPSEGDKRHGATCERHAQNLLDAAQRGDYATATRDFDAHLRAALPASKLKQAWESLSRFGVLQARGQMHPGMGQGYYVVSIPLIFEKANLYAQIACDGDDHIAGFHVNPLDIGP